MCHHLFMTAVLLFITAIAALLATASLWWAHVIGALLATCVGLGCFFVLALAVLIILSDILRRRRRNPTAAVTVERVEIAA
jgi:hypothetical protein